jgi:hypothetical protein
MVEAVVGGPNQRFEPTAASVPLVVPSRFAPRPRLKRDVLEGALLDCSHVVIRNHSMIFHASIPADDPEQVARVLADLCRCEYFPFIAPQTFVVIPGDDRGTELEIAPRGLELTPAEREVGFQKRADASTYNEVHLNIATPLSLEEVLGIAKREAWTARLCDRGGAFNVIEFWLEDKFMLELMTERELKRYRNVMTAAVWREGQQLGR